MEWSIRRVDLPKSISDFFLIFEPVNLINILVLYICKCKRFHNLVRVLVFSMRCLRSDWYAEILNYTDYDNNR